MYVETTLSSLDRMITCVDYRVKQHIPATVTLYTCFYLVPGTVVFPLLCTTTRVTVDLCFGTPILSYIQNAYQQWSMTYKFSAIAFWPAMWHDMLCKGGARNEN
jgi:hypothetical protein